MPLTKTHKKWLKSVSAVLALIAGSHYAGSYFDHFLNDKTPKLVVNQLYNTVEPKKPVPVQVGGLILDYQASPQNNVNQYVVQIENIGRGPEEDVGISVQFSSEVTASEPNIQSLKIYRPENALWNESTYFMSLGQFPKDAFANLAFEVKNNINKLCETNVKVAGKQVEAQIEKIKGLECN
ncbi:hypothetical protein K1X76_12385 [bacterium]|nr:hypothetical protein [bacterium]